jgi:UDP-glucose 4-epimerase
LSHPKPTVLKSVTFCRAGNQLHPHEPKAPRLFTAYLKTWLANEPGVQAPRYVRDNIRLSPLAKATFVGASPAPGAVHHLTPSGGYPESQGAFAERVRSEAATRFGGPCEPEFGTQTDFAEPPVRINTDLCDTAALGRGESKAV